MKEINWPKMVEVLIAWQGVASTAITVMTAAAFWVFRDRLPPQLPLFYSHPWGEEQLSSPWGMIQPVILVWLILAITYIANKLKVDRILAGFTAGVGLVAQTVIIIGVIRIFFLVI